MPKEEFTLEVCGQTQGRALFIGHSGELYVSRGAAIHRSSDGGKTWVLDCRVLARGWKPLAAYSTLAARLLRFNVQALQVLRDGSRVAVARDGIYRAEGGECEMRRTWALTRGSRPINLSADGNRLLFGEYGGKEMNAAQVKIYCSDDRGKTFEPVYEFPTGDVHHIHNVIVDEFSSCYWVLAGDHGREPGIAALSKDFRHLDWLARGSQMVRAVNVLPRKDCLIYGSDSELEPNFVVRVDKQSGRFERVTPIEGSSLYAATVGQMSLISTSVEPSRVNHGTHCLLYASTDDWNWKPIMSFRKDRWNPVLFQFGTIVLPYIRNPDVAVGMLSGQAVVDWHNKVSLFPAR